jgi:uncharacterized iron-regulated membrane protein
MVLKKIWMDWHSWLGLKMSLLMLIICVTGTISVVSHEIDWLIDSDLRIDAQQAPIDWDAMTLKAKKAYPERRLSFIQRPIYSNSASILLMNDPFLGARRVHSNPYTGEVLGDKPWYSSVQRIFRDLHRYLLSPVAGIYLVGPFGIILLLSVISALLFYKKWWRGFFKLRLNKGYRAFIGSLHKVTGLWSIWFILLISLTGVWYLAEAVIRDVGVKIQFKRPNVSEQTWSDRQLLETTILPSKAVAIAKAQYTHFDVASIYFPTTQARPIMITGYTDIPLVRARSNSVFIDPVTGEVLDVRRTEQQTLLEIWIDLADPLHFGDFGGLWTKVIWFIFGLAICALSATGLIIFIKRIKQRHNTPFGRKVWGNGRYAIYAILIIPAFFGILLFAKSMDWLPRPHVIANQIVSIQDAKASLILSKKDDIYYLSIVPIGQNLLLPVEPVVILSDGTIIPFLRKNRVINIDSARLSKEQLKKIKSIVWQQDKRLYYSLSLEQGIFTWI